MKVIIPVPVDDARLISSSVPENDAPAWAAGTAYAVGDKVLHQHRIFERVKAGTTAATPAADPTNWLDTGASNRWAMFDRKVGSQTTAANQLVVVLRPGKLTTGLALINCSAQTARVRMTDPHAGVVYDRTFSFGIGKGITSWYRWFFWEIERKTTLVVTDLPAYVSAEIEITLAMPGGTVKCGVLQIGKTFVIGESLWGLTIGLEDWSRKERDPFGNYDVVERGYSLTNRVPVSIAYRDIDAVMLTLSRLRATPAVYLPDYQLDSAVLYGFFKDLSPVVNHRAWAECQIEIEGLT